VKRIVVIDYGSGNLRSVAKALAAVAAADETVTVSDAVADVINADRLVLPGVGAFADCYRGLAALPEMIPALRRRVLEQNAPFLGICVGMQLLADAGYEHETSAGLGWIQGTVRPLPAPAGGKIPHMGWNTLHLTKAAHPLFRGIAPDTHMYFVHSYHFMPQQPQPILATTEYGQPVVAALGQNSIVGTQFHPEKSQAAGLQLLRNFLDWRC
jgi:imidazole glycerol-phosphate synthase subunit HisH